MATIDRRTVLRDFLPGVIVIVAGAAAAGTLGASLASTTPAEASPVVVNKIDAARLGERLDKPQPVFFNPRRRRRRPLRRRWVCWWRRGRRVCGWRWV